MTELNMTANQGATLRALREHTPGGRVFVDVAGSAADSRNAGEAVLVRVIVEHPDTGRMWRLVIEPAGDEQPLTLTQLGDEFDAEEEADEVEPVTVADVFHADDVDVRGYADEAGPWVDVDLSPAPVDAGDEADPVVSVLMSSTEARGLAARLVEAATGADAEADKAL
jgi:hypothetical protein